MQIQTPAAVPGYLTTTVLYSGTSILTQPITTTVYQPSGSNLGLVQIQTPGVKRYVTETVLFTGSSRITAPLTTTIYEATGTNAGLVQVQTPGAGYITSTVPYTGTSSLGGPLTTTLYGPSGTNAGFVEVATPGSYSTTTVLYTGSSSITGPITTTVYQPTGTNAGLVQVQTPARPLVSLHMQRKSHPLKLLLIRPVYPELRDDDNTIHWSGSDHRSHHNDNPTSKRYAWYGLDRNTSGHCDNNTSIHRPWRHYPANLHNDSCSWRSVRHRNCRDSCVDHALCSSVKHHSNFHTCSH